MCPMRGAFFFSIVVMTAGLGLAAGAGEPAAGETTAGAAAWTTYYDRLINTFNGVGLVVIAGVGVWIAWRQNSINKQRLKHELFEKRHAIYQALEDVIKDVHAKADVKDEHIAAMFRAESAGKFLFGPGVVKEITALRFLLHRLGSVIMDFQNPTDEEARQKAKDEKWAILKSLAEDDVPALIAMVPHLQLFKDR